MCIYSNNNEKTGARVCSAFITHCKYYIHNDFIHIVYNASAQKKVHTVHETLDMLQEEGRSWYGM